MLRRKGQKDENELLNLEIHAQENLLLDTRIIFKAKAVPESLIRISALNLFVYVVHRCLSLAACREGNFRLFVLVTFLYGSYCSK